MKRVLHAGILLVSALGLSGCMLTSWMNDGEGLILNPNDDYLDTQEQAPLEVPEDLRGLAGTDPFPIPETQRTTNPRFYPNRPPLPDAIYANDNRDEVRIQRLGARRWLVVPESPTTAWPKLKQFLAENGISVVAEAPQVGRLNTEWMKIDDTNYRDVVRTLLRDAKQGGNLARGMDRFLIRVEQGMRPASTEIHVRHENDSLTLPVDDGLVDLQTMASDLEGAESDILSEIGAYIAANVSQQTVSKVAQQIGSIQKAEMSRDRNGDPYLRLYLDYERAWATLGQALENAEVEVLSLDRQRGAFFVTVDEESFGGEEDSGFLCRLTFSCDDGGDAHDLQLQITNPENQVFEVTVLDPQTQQPVDSELAQQVLVLLREYST